MFSSHEYLSLSLKAKSLWAKLPRNGDESYLPLFAHMADSAEMARLLWRFWVPSGTKEIIENSVPRAEQIFVFLAAVHDIGKAIPAFQLARPLFSQACELARNQISGCGLICPTPLSDPSKIPHSLATYLILTTSLNVPRELAIIVGGHHGKPPSSADIENANSFPANTGIKDLAWTGVQKELFNYSLELSGVKDNSFPVPNVATQSILSGLVIMTDWLASDENRFKYIEFGAGVSSSAERAAAAWDDLMFPLCWEPFDEDALARFNLYTERFDGIEQTRPAQDVAMSAANDTREPGIFIIEAPMGEGKTEAALVAAEIFASKTGRAGLFFALPTQATSDGLFPRIKRWINRLGARDETHSITLAHGHARFNKDFVGIKYISANIEPDDGTANESLIVHEWFDGRKKSILADFVVGTVDHILMGSLKQRHLAMRHLGLANKVVVIDECHAYDAYMSSYLYKTLNWLGKYKTPVIILSATLPAGSRMKLVEAYRNMKFTSNDPPDPVFGNSVHTEPPPWAVSREYPLITYSDGTEIRQLNAELSRHIDVKISRLGESRNVGEVIADKFDDLLSGGGCAGVIVNTVRRAQEIAKFLVERFSDDVVRLLHAQFIGPSRVAEERNLRDKLGRDAVERPSRLIVVGTQVMEQSLDVDFDVLFTDICPMDLLLQRIGRLHRHDRERPPKLKSAMCFVTGVADGEFESGSVIVYGKYHLMNTLHLLPDEIRIPVDIPNLVQNAYDECGLNIDSDDYRKAKEEHKNLLAEKERRARAFQIKSPGDCTTLVGWLDTSVTDDAKGHRAKANVRDGGDSVEVIVIQQCSNGKFYTLPSPDVCDEMEIPHSTPGDATASAVAECSLRLPAPFTNVYNIDKVISEIEENNIRVIPAAWQSSHYLKDELFLVLDETFSTELMGIRLTYSEKYGLRMEK